MFHMVQKLLAVKRESCYSIRLEMLLAVKCLTFIKINIGRCGMCPRFAKRMNAGRYGDLQIYGEDVSCTELMS